jgi:diguanylate cyclase (GGDEF)-like protein
MNLRWRKLPPQWLLAAVVLLTTVTAGARLAVLSRERHASQARRSAQIAVTRAGQALEVQLEHLVHSATDPTARNRLWIAADGAVQLSPGSNAMLANSIANELAAANARQGNAATTPERVEALRVGSQWIAVARTSVPGPPGRAAGQPGGTTVGYLELEQLLAHAGFGQLPTAGYDFELSQIDRVTPDRRVLLSSRATPLAEPVTGTIRFPGGRWTLALSPREGWYPVADLLVRIAVLATVALTLSLMAHDAVRTTWRLRAALAILRRRLQAANQRLLEEVQQREDLQKSVDHAQYHDAFTGLPNRRYFMNRLDQGLREARLRRHYGLGVVLLECDRFQMINDTLGQEAGDELILQAARRFEESLTAFEHVLARWGGGQFALLLFDVHSVDTALSVAGLLHDALRAPFELRKSLFSLSTRTGLTCVQGGLRRASDVAREADIALSAARTRESAEAVVFSPALNRDAASLIHLESDLHLALERRELRLLYQPIVELRSSRIVGLEALLRWQHPTEGLLGPDKFLPIAEELGLLVPITRWIIRKTCKVASGWRTQLPPAAQFYVSVNLPEAELRRTDLADYIEGILKQMQLPAQMLRLEITEGSLISNVGAARELLVRLRGMGVQLMLDDFGTGYSSLSYLQLFPIEYLKIDRSFVSRVGPDGSNSGLLRAILQMATSLGLKAVAEGIESQSTLHQLQEMGCECGQGYFFAKPAAADVASQWLRVQFRSSAEERGIENPEAASGISSSRL